MSDMQIAETIAQQLGGTKRLATMTGAKNFYGLPNGLMFSIPAMPEFPDVVVRKVEILLNAHDLYDVRFMDGRGKDLSAEKDVFVEDLKETIERNTGLYLSLPRVRTVSGMEW